MLSFYNTLSGRMEEFVPLQKGQVRLYTCGPTVYDYAHIGNYRSFLFGDILRRHLRGSGFELLHVMNITDVDDKTIRNAAAAGLSLSEYTDRFIQAFFEDSANLSLQRPELVPRATEHIPDMVRTIRQLGDKGFTYSREGSVYFRIANFPQYGKLSKIDLSGMQPGARIDQDEYEKADIRDFVLWKAPKPGEPFWETELGPGRPGWHIECSVMANKYLGESFDIHAGGADLIFPHHENEIAQSEALSGKTFVRYWLHCAHLLVDGQKMSKSTGNYLTLRDLLQQGHTAASIRYLLSSVPYRRQLNFTTDGLRQAAHSIERLKNFRFRPVAHIVSGGNKHRHRGQNSRFPRPAPQGDGRRPEYGPGPGSAVRVGASCQFGDRPGRVPQQEHRAGSRLPGTVERNLRGAPKRSRRPLRTRFPSGWTGCCPCLCRKSRHGFGRNRGQDAGARDGAVAKKFCSGRPHPGRIERCRHSD